MVQKIKSVPVGSLPKGRELDLGPMRIIGCTHVTDASTGPHGRYILSLTAGGSLIQILASGGGNSVRVLKDGIELTAEPVAEAG
jgi:hypothetical protein